MQTQKSALERYKPGRPKIQDRHPVSTALRSDQVVKLRVLSVERDLSIGHMIRQAVDLWLDAELPPIDDEDS
jgi:hypothetical protein